MAQLFLPLCTGDTNPCVEMRCGPDSYCVARADGGGAECVCSPGFEKVRLSVVRFQLMK